MYILYAILFFSWFISFSIINIEAFDWGLQVSWFLCIMFSIYFIALFLTKKNWVKEKISFNIIDVIFLVIFLITIFNYLFFSIFDIIQNKYSLFNFEYEISLQQLKKRSMPHLLYIIFLWFCTKNIYISFSYHKDVCHIWIKKYFITFPFFFIGIWAIYQWISTFDIIPYLKIFNNNISTGFTYLRFKMEHRASSVFPEPSEYAYFLAFYLPIVLSFLFKEKNVFFLTRNKLTRICVCLFYFFQVFLCRSMSYFLMFPIILLYSINTVIEKKRVFMNIVYFSLMILFGVLIYATYGQRLLNILTGIDGSMLIRLSGLFGGIVLFLVSPMTGFGYGAIRGLDMFSFLLACFGIIGTLLLLLCINKLKIIAKNNDMSELFYHGLISMIIVALISNPILEYIGVWIILAVIVFFGKKKVYYR